MAHGDAVVALSRKVKRESFASLRLRGRSSAGCDGDGDRLRLLVPREYSRATL